MTTQVDQGFVEWMSDKSFLVVEDVSSSRLLEASLLRGLGARTVVTAVDGADAVSKLESGATQPDIIICDWLMPGLDGIGVLEHAKRLIPGIKVVMVTSKSGLEDAKLAHDKGADGYVAKPFTRETLLAVLKRLRGV